MASEAFKRKCLIYTAFNIMDMYEKRMKILENEAQVRTTTRCVLNITFLISYAVAYFAHAYVTCSTGETRSDIT